MGIGFHLDDVDEAYFSNTQKQKMYELNEQIRNLKKQLKTARVEAIKEFAERAKEMSSQIVIGGKYKYQVVTTECIDNLVKMTEENNAES